MGYWQVPLIIKSNLHSLAHSLKGHVGIEIIYGTSDEERYYLTSPHFNFEEHEYEEAYYTAKGLLYIVNGVLKLFGISKFEPYQEEVMWRINEDEAHNYPIYVSNKEKMYEKILNPFISYETEVTKNGISDYVKLAYDNDLIREVFILYNLSQEDPLYFLANVYKIQEIIDFDKNNSDIEGLQNEELNILLKKNKKFNRYINTRDGSKIFSRHGAAKEKGPEEAPLFEDINTNTVNLIHKWIDIHLEDAYKIRYNKSYKPGEILEPMTDEDYDYFL
ncbi:hypothetical protein ATL39_0907 [Sinobaca qinghaiensis]|uniref:Uncharacterized protein n=1 Tax=Sinobaca qinghaiensis TaxID=342944 RepID=A0A419V5H8_9BACL|nr:hypothetical protein [Sinobaca qinghaiensis]RKD75209.1 hypothetical protein ATL39_0907 [Sinobaca qinghaiensis]